MERAKALTHRMSKTLIPPISQHILPSTRSTDDKLVVVLSERNGAFDPEPGPDNVEQVTCDTNCAVGKDENVSTAREEVRTGEEWSLVSPIAA